jgi:hypothetical protein
VANYACYVIIDQDMLLRICSNQTCIIMCKRNIQNISSKDNKQSSEWLDLEYNGTRRDTIIQ